MVAVSHRRRLVYYPVPKVACTSLKVLFYRLDTNRDPGSLRTRDGAPVDIHSVYWSNPDRGRWSPVYETYFSFAVLRDPVERFVSGFRNRIHHHRDLERERSVLLGRHRLPTRPDFDVFVRLFPLYFRASAVVRHHFRPQRDFVSRVVGRVSRVYRLEELDVLRKDLEEWTEVPVAIPELQTGGRGVDVAPTADHVRWIREYMRPDYAMLERVGFGPGPGAPGAHGLAPRVLRRLAGI